MRPQACHLVLGLAIEYMSIQMSVETSAVRAIAGGLFQRSKFVSDPSQVLCSQHEAYQVYNKPLLPTSMPV